MRYSVSPHLYSLDLRYKAKFQISGGDATFEGVAEEGIYIRLPLQRDHDLTKFHVINLELASLAAYQGIIHPPFRADMYARQERGRKHGVRINVRFS